MLSISSLRDLSILITVVSNSRSGNSNTPSMSISDACLFKLGFLTFGIPCNFFLRAGHDIWDKRNAVDRAFHNVAVRCRGVGSVLYSADYISVFY